MLEGGWRAYQRRLGRERTLRRRGQAAALVGALTLGLAGLAGLAGTGGEPEAADRAVGHSGHTAAAAVDLAPAPPAGAALAGEFRLDPSDWARAETVDGAVVVPLPGGHQARLTLDPDLQERLEAVLRRARAIAGALVVLDPHDGRVLGLASSSRVPGLDLVALRGHFPAASLFKIITAAAGLEAGTLTPTTLVRTIGGGLRRIRLDHLIDNPERERLAMTVREALARSNNPVFGKIAVKRVGAERLAVMANAFAFNRPIPFDLPLDPSLADVPEDTLGLGRTGAGFGEVTISPLHAALVAAAIANEGRMPSPWVVDRVTDAAGRVLYEGEPSLLGAPISPRTARALARMMAETVTHGTSRRAFRSFHAEDIAVAGKTGSLDGRDPDGRYDWFAGFAPIDEPEVAVAAMLVNGPIWHLKGSGAAREALEAYFRLRNRQER